MIELYQQALKEHNNNPVGLAKSIQATHTAEGYNASCGDEITFSLKLSSEHKLITEMSFECDCCAICKASASALCKLCEGRDIDFLEQQSQLLAQIFNQPEQQTFAVDNIASSEFETELSFLVPIKQHISRHNCALLPWQTALDACTQPIPAKQTN